MENLLPKAPSRKRRHKFHGSRRDRDDKFRKHPLPDCTDARKAADCFITQNRLTRRMGLFNKGSTSDTILRADGGGGEGGDEHEGRWRKMSLYEGQAKTFSHHRPTTKESHVKTKENRMTSSTVDENKTSAANVLTRSLPSLPNIEKLSLFLTDHIDPKSIMPSGYLQRVKKQLQDQYKAAVQKMEEDKENRESDAQMKPGPSQAVHRTRTHAVPFQALENTEDAPAAAAAAFWWSSAEDKRLNIPPPASGPPPYRDTTWPNPSSAHIGNVKDLWSADDGPPMRNHADVVSQPLLDPTDPKSLLELNDLMYHHHQSRSCPAASIPPLSGLGLPPFISANPADSGPSSSEWAVDLDRGCLRYIQQSTRKNSSFPYFNQTDGECDILDIADTNPISTNYLLQLSSEHSNNIPTTMATDADGDEEDRTELVGGFLSLKNSEGSLDETLDSWEVQLPKLFLASVHSPSPKQKYYRRKVF